MANIFELIESGDLGSIKAAIAADPMALRSVGAYGESPLMRAISWMDRDYSIIEFLVTSGADVNFKTEEGYTALHYNIDLNGPSGTGEIPYKVVRLLKEHGADVEAKNHYGWTPLMRAALEGTEDEFKALLEIGARYDVVFDSTRSLPEFTRGLSIAHVILPEPEKLRLLIKFGFRPTETLIVYAHEIRKGTDKHGRFSQAIKHSVEIIKEHIDAS